MAREAKLIRYTTRGGALTGAGPYLRTTLPDASYAERVRSRVEEQFGVRLETEVRFIGFPADR